MKTISNNYANKVIKLPSLTNFPNRVLCFVPRKGLFLPTETEMDSHMDYCTKQVFPLVQTQIPIPSLKYSKVGMEMCPWDGDPSLKWVQ